MLKALGEDPAAGVGQTGEQGDGRAAAVGRGAEGICTRSVETNRRRLNEAEQSIEKLRVSITMLGDDSTVARVNAVMAKLESVVFDMRDLLGGEAAHHGGAVPGLVEALASVALLADGDGAPYLWWTGGGTEDALYPFYVTNDPGNAYIREHGITCAGLINILQHRVVACDLARTRGDSGDSDALIPCIPGQPSDEGDSGTYRGGVVAWTEHLRAQGVLEAFSYDRSYPVGTLFLREFRSVLDQGHVAVLTTQGGESTLHGEVIHAYAYGCAPPTEDDGEAACMKKGGESKDQRHAGNEGSAQAGRVGLSVLGHSHFALPLLAPTGYYEFAVMPRDWLCR